MINYLSGDCNEAVDDTGQHNGFRKCDLVFTSWREIVREVLLYIVSTKLRTLPPSLALPHHCGIEIYVFHRSHEEDAFDIESSYGW
jgi:hypothetical protein